MPAATGLELYERAVELEKFSVSADELGEVVSLDVSGAVTMTYYRNNILHLFALPSLISAAVVYHNCQTRSDIDQVVMQLYPLIKNELFIGYDDDSLPGYIDSILATMVELKLLNQDQQGEEQSVYSVVADNKPQLTIMAQHIQETIERYAIVLKIMEKKPNIERNALSHDSHVLAQRLSKIHGINAPEFFDKAVLSTFISGLREQGYLYSQAQGETLKSTTQLVDTVSRLLRPTVLTTIKASLN